MFCRRRNNICQSGAVVLVGVHAAHDDLGIADALGEAAPYPPGQLAVEIEGCVVNLGVDADAVRVAPADLVLCFGAVRNCDGPDRDDAGVVVGQGLGVVCPALQRGRVVGVAGVALAAMVGLPAKIITGSSGRERIHDGYPDVALDMIASRTFDGPNCWSTSQLFWPDHQPLDAKLRASSGRALSRRVRRQTQPRRLDRLQDEDVR